MAGAIARDWRLFFFSHFNYLFLWFHRLYVQYLIHLMKTGNEVNDDWQVNRILAYTELMIGHDYWFWRSNHSHVECEFDIFHMARFSDTNNIQVLHIKSYWSTEITSPEVYTQRVLPSRRFFWYNEPKTLWISFFPSEQLIISWLHYKSWHRIDM